MVSSTSCYAHVSAFFFSLRESVNTKHQPCTTLEVFVVVVKYSRESTVVKFLDSSVGLTHFISFFEVLRNL